MKETPNHNSLFAEFASAHAGEKDKNESKVHEMTYSKETYAEANWGLYESVRDLLQNNLDAETAKFYWQTLFTVFDREKTLALIEDQKSPELVKAIHEFGFRLYYYKRFLQKQKVDNLEYFSHIPPILDGTDVFLPEIFKDGDFDYVGWLHETRFQSEQKPVVRFLFRDNKTGQTQWLHEEDTRSLYETGSLFIERVILAIDIADTGAGYAPDSLATYQSDKPFTHQRGKFGEGAKLAEFELSRAQMLQVNTSVYQTADKTVGWYARPHTTPEGIVEILGKKVSVERVEGQKTGSSTRIVFKPEKDAKERTSQDDKRSLIAYFLNTTAEGKLPIRADERAQFKYSPEVLLGLQPLCAGGYICTGPRC